MSAIQELALHTLVFLLVFIAQLDISGLGTGSLLSPHPRKGAEIHSFDRPFEGLQWRHYFEIGFACALCLLAFARFCWSLFARQSPHPQTQLKIWLLRWILPLALPCAVSLSLGFELNNDIGSALLRTISNGHNWAVLWLGLPTRDQLREVRRWRDEWSGASWQTEAGVVVHCEGDEEYPSELPERSLTNFEFSKHSRAKDRVV